MTKVWVLTHLCFKLMWWDRLHLSSIHILRLLGFCVSQPLLTSLTGQGPTPGLFPGGGEGSREMMSILWEDRSPSCSVFWKTDDGTFSFQGVLESTVFHLDSSPQVKPRFYGHGFKRPLKWERTLTLGNVLVGTQPVPVRTSVTPGNTRNTELTPYHIGHLKDPSVPTNLSNTLGRYGVKGVTVLPYCYHW